MKGHESMVSFIPWSKTQARSPMPIKQFTGAAAKTVLEEVCWASSCSMIRQSSMQAVYVLTGF